MTPHRALNWLLATFIALIMASAHLLDGPSDADTEALVAASLNEAQRAEQMQARFDRAARALCGDNGGAWVLIDDNTVQCFTHRGYKTHTAKLGAL